MTLSVDALALLNDDGGVLLGQLKIDVIELVKSLVLLEGHPEV